MCLLFRAGSVPIVSSWFLAGRTIRSSALAILPHKHDRHLQLHIRLNTHDKFAKARILRLLLSYCCLHDRPHYRTSTNYEQDLGIVLDSQFGRSRTCYLYMSKSLPMTRYENSNRVEITTTNVLASSHVDQGYSSSSTNVT